MTGPELRMRLGYWLEGMGACREPGWLEAVQAVPREVLVPTGYGQYANHGKRVDRAICSDQEWLELLNHDVTIVTREDELGFPISSSTMPGMVTKMLDFMHAEDDHNVLEVGTGTGFSTALLSHRLGSEHVTSVDVQEDLVQRARERLRSIGYTPRLMAVDGVEGYQPGAPYDRVIGTCFTWPVPPAWLRQVRPGGRVVAAVPTGVVGLDVAADGSASGRYHDEVFGFMFMQSPHMPARLAESSEIPPTTGTREWRHPPRLLEAGGRSLPFALLAHTVAMPYVHADSTGDGAELRAFNVGDGSWAMIEQGAPTVTQGGPRRIWDEVEELYGKWCALGAPARERFGLTVTPDGHHTLWLDDPDSEHRWEVRPLS